MNARKLKVLVGVMSGFVTMLVASTAFAQAAETASADRKSVV